MTGKPGEEIGFLEFSGRLLAMFAALSFVLGYLWSGGYGNIYFDASAHVACLSLAAIAFTRPKRGDLSRIALVSAFGALHLLSTTFLVLFLHWKDDHVGAMGARLIFLAIALALAASTVRRSILWKASQ